MLPVSVVPAPFAATGGVPAPTALSVLPGQTVQAPAPAIGAPITGNQRRPATPVPAGEAEGAESPPEGGTFAFSPPGREPTIFGDSSAFLAQLFDQTDAIKYRPSTAGFPPPPQSMLSLAQPAEPPPPTAWPPMAANQNEAQRVVGALQHPAGKTIERTEPHETPPVPTSRVRAGHCAYQASQARLRSAPDVLAREAAPVDAVA